MRDIHNDSVQNRFTAYLMAAVTNKRIGYFSQRKRRQEREKAEMDLSEKKYADFEAQYRAYLVEKSAPLYEDAVDLQEVMRHIGSEKLVRIIGRLKEREKQILFARVFGERSFEGLGAEFHMEAKQAEMAYYYIIRKLRKGMEGWNDEF